MCWLTAHERESGSFITARQWTLERTHVKSLGQVPNRR
jgi:hypothetical protein